MTPFMRSLRKTQAAGHLTGKGVPLQQRLVARRWIETFLYCHCRWMTAALPFKEMFVCGKQSILRPLPAKHCVITSLGTATHRLALPCIVQKRNDQVSKA